MSRILIHLVLLTYLSLALNAQNDFIDNSDRVITIKRATSAITLDGILDEETWQTAEQAGDFWVKFPVNDRKGDPPTTVQLSYDDKYLYVAFTIIQTPNGNIVQSLKRDFGLRAGDGIGIILDPLNQKTNGFYFSLNPYNSQTEGLITNSFDEVTFTWDNTWYSETKLYADHWTAEIAIPFAILRYEEQKTSWGINFIRAARENNEFHTWTRIPLQFTGTDLGYTGQLNWDKAPPTGGSTISLSPYSITGINADPENDQATSATISAGLDAKIALSSSINLDLTIHPDFSNVDVDEQVTNLTRFSIFFPERRFFFLENDDLFSSFGFPLTRPFYSRRIGSKGGTTVPILFGARLTGNLNEDFRFGVMNIQTGRKDDLEADNFTMATFNQRVLERSSIRGYFLNRSAFQNEQDKLTNPQGAYGRNAGLELLYFSKSGTIQAWATGHLSFKPNIEGNNYFSSLGGGYFGENFTSFLDYSHTGENYFADVGFVNRIENYDALRDTIIRIGQNYFYNETSYSFWMKESTLNRIELASSHFLATNQHFQFNELTLEPSISFEFKSTANIDLGMSFNEVELFFPFSFVSGDNPPLPAARYSFSTFDFSVDTDRRKNFMFSFGTSLGRFYNADFRQFQASLSIRKQPYFSLTLSAEHNDLHFPEMFGRQSFWLIAPQIEINFTNNLFWTSFLQWNSQADNFNINSRIQWRYKAMSDIFLVYTDNYFTNIAFQNKNRAIVLKANYWLNL